MQQRHTYDYSQLGQANVSRKNSVLRKTYTLLGLSFLPCALGAYLGINFNFAAMLSQGLHSGFKLIAFLIFFYGLCFAIEKNRYNKIGATLLFVLTFGLGCFLTPILQFALSSRLGGQVVGMAAIMTTVVFLTMAVMAHRTKANMDALGRFLSVGAIVLIVAMVLNFFLKIPALYLTISAVFVIFSSLMIMWQIRTVIDGGEDSYISAALTIFISIYNIFVSLVQILLALMDNR